MTGTDGRVPLAPQEGDEHEWTYLLPVVAAERSWGNEPQGEFERIGRGDGWLLTFRQPLHVEALRERFDFPDFVELVDTEPRTALVDTRFPYQAITIEGSRPPGWKRAESPTGYVRDDGLGSRLVRRLLGARDERR